MGKYDFGFDEYIAKLKATERRAPGLVIAELEKEQRQIKSAYRKRVRTEAHIGNGKKHLHNGLRHTPVEKVSGIYEGGVYNDPKKAPHYHLVERGHRKVIHGKTKGTVAGKFYFKRSVESLEPKIERQRRRMVQRMYEELT